MSILKNKYFLLGATALASFLVDQYTKQIALAHLTENANRNVIPGFFDLTLRYNTGAAFSLFSSASLAFFLVISALAIGALIYFVFTLEPERSRQALALGVILGGALGNLLDRLRLGGVVDFLLFYYKGFAWPAFNAADTAIICGVAFFLVQNFSRPAALPPQKGD